MASVSNRRGQQSLLSSGPNDKSSVSTKGKGGGNGKASAAAVNDAPVIYDTGTGGCLICKKDTDHDRLLICEFCNAEYHIYCLDPPLEAVPEGDFFCDRCKMFREGGDTKDDGLNELVEALPPSFTSRFGEICWAAGGNGFGWWPSCVYDPRLTVGIARSLARKNLGKRHLVYFFECLDAPFSVLPSAKLTSWEDGFQEEYDLGKAAKGMGKARARMFERALQIAKLEVEKPLDLRMDWNHKEGLLLKRNLSAPKQSKKRKNEAGVVVDSEEDGIPTALGLNSILDDSEANPLERAASLVSSLHLSITDLELLANHYNTLQSKYPHQSVTRRSNLEAVLEALPSSTFGATAIEQPDGHLYCKLLRKDIDGTAEDNIGFLKMDCRRTATFSDARNQIAKDLDGDCLPLNWKFYVPKLGPVSRVQEQQLVMLDFLTSTTSNLRLGDGSSKKPLKLIIEDCSNTNTQPNTNIHQFDPVG